MLSITKLMFSVMAADPIAILICAFAARAKKLSRPSISFKCGLNSMRYKASLSFPNFIFSSMVKRPGKIRSSNSSFLP